MRPVTPPRRTRFALVAALLAAAAGAAGCGDGGAAAPAARPAPPRPIQALTMAPTQARVTGDYLGTLLSRASVLVLPQVSGYVRKVHVRPGQVVAAGAPLVDIDAREEGAALASAAAQADSAGASLALAEQSRARVEALFREGLATAQELDQRRADVAAAQAAVRAAGAQVAQRRVAVGNNVVRAPVPGVIGEVATRLGDFVTASTRLTTIAGEDGLELTVGIPAARARGLALGAPVEVLTDDDRLLHRGMAFFIGAEAEPRTQLVAVKTMVPAGLGLRPGEMVRVRVTYAVEQALQVPALAVVRQGGAAFLFVVGERAGALVVERRPVQLGALGPDGFVVAAGLHAGERVAVSSIQQLRDGAAVVIEPAPGAGSGSGAGSGAK